ncbi:unnamed protein product [Nezara viridula]|uniref:Uncharacterized protein n=1 Tax=Nezara viridula TaxID=85310 RepID=A0A9P0HD36_NEZVI|nr:unnamed protein product [Nezara viridula]
MRLSPLLSTLYLPGILFSLIFTLYELTKEAYKLQRTEICRSYKALTGRPPSAPVLCNNPRPLSPMELKSSRRNKFACKGPLALIELSKRFPRGSLLISIFGALILTYAVPETLHALGSSTYVRTANYLRQPCTLSPVPDPTGTVSGTSAHLTYLYMRLTSFFLGFNRPHFDDNLMKQCNSKPVYLLSSSTAALTSLTIWNQSSNFLYRVLPSPQQVKPTVS